MDARKAEGTLMIIGGAEDSTDATAILKRFMQLAGGASRPLLLITAASKVPEHIWEDYRPALLALGATSLHHLALPDRDAADDEETARLVARAAGVLMTGGDQKRLIAIIGGTRVAQAMREAHRIGACIAGTSAGASVMCTHMIAEGKAEFAPQKDATQLARGLGFVTEVVIDQHFSQRHRINRLLGVLAQRPQLLGVGIDEDTALIVHGSGEVEVMGEGNVTVLDCRQSATNIDSIAAGDVPEMIDVRLHLLPSGSTFRLDGGGERSAMPPPGVRDFIQYLSNGAT